jgi:diguanylate cyclase (GGDEF)-like protein
MASRRATASRPARLLPSGRVLAPPLWEARHRGIVLLLWAHVPFLAAIGLVRHYSVAQVAFDLSAVVLSAVCASCSALRRGVRAGVATFGLVACSAILVLFSGGVIEMHFHFFVVVGIITLYQDWSPFLIALLFTVLEHGVVGVLDPQAVYNHHAAQHNPWLWAGVHGAFVLAASVPHVLAWRQSEDQALRDPLTGLSNRTLVADSLRRMLDHAPDARLAVLFVDLDHFQQVNDSLGHRAGDELLVVCARRLRGCVRNDDVIGRFGGDEFAVILTDESAEVAEEIAGRVLDVIAEPAVVGDHEIVMHASIGIAYASPGLAVDELLRNADFAMYVAKASGRARYERFDGAMHDRARDRFELAGELRQAVANDEITIVCQPIVDLATGCITGAEVLARWTHPERGPISPAAFVPVAERTGLICEMGLQVFDRACAVARRLHAIDPSLTVTVNVSPVQLADDSLPALFAERMRRHGVDPQRVVVEVTETVLMQDLRLAAQRLGELKKIGVRVAVDDFGVGHSSLSYLRNLPVDVLKVDKSFVDELPAGGDVTRMMIQLGRMLGLDVIAEGVESAEQREALLALGCPRAQGFFYARPMPPDALVHDLTSGSLRTRPRQLTAGRHVASVPA